MIETSNIFYPIAGPESILLRQIWKINKSKFLWEEERILPKGTAEIIFNLSGKTLCFKDSENSSFDFYKCNINGLNTSTYHLINSESQIFVGIQLHAFSLKSLFGIPAKEFTGNVFNAFDICPSLMMLFDRIQSTDSFDHQVQYILFWLRQQFKLQNYPTNKYAIFDLHRCRNIEALSVQSISKQYNLSSRHLRRLSQDYIGINMADFILYYKYLTSLYKIHNKNQSLTSIACESGFYDQAHFIRAFKGLTGLTPGEYRKHMSSLPGHLFRNR